MPVRSSFHSRQIWASVKIHQVVCHPLGAMVAIPPPDHTNATKCSVSMYIVFRALVVSWFSRRELVLEETIMCRSGTLVRTHVFFIAVLPALSQGACETAFFVVVVGIVSKQKLPVVKGQHGLETHPTK